MKRSRGQGLVEFALALPIFLLVLFGLIDVGRGVFAANSLNNAAREAGRMAAVNQDKPTVWARGINQAQIISPNITVAYFLPPATPLQIPSIPCGTFDGAGHVLAAPTVGCVAVVTVTAPFKAITPIIGDIIGTLNLAAKNVVSIEFPCPDPSRPTYPFQTAASCPRQP